MAKEDSQFRMEGEVVEVFGLPGDRYTTYVDANYMDFLFRDEQDRLLFLTGWPAHVPSKETTV